MRFATLWLLLLCGGGAFGQSVEAPSVAKRDRPVVINHPDGAEIQAIYARVTGGAVVWEYLPDDHFVRTPTQTIFSAPPGDYLVTSGDSTILKVVEEGGPSPRPQPDPPDPKPEPQPEPDPEPAPDQLRVQWAIWVEEIADRPQHPDATGVMVDAESRRLLTDRGISVRVYDDDQAEASPFVAVADELPALILMESEDRFLTFPAPTSRDELEQIVRRHAIR